MTREQPITKNLEVKKICEEQGLTLAREYAWADEAYEKFYYEMERNYNGTVNVHLSKIQYQIYKSRVAEYIDLQRNEFLKAGYEEVIKTYRKNEQELLIAEAVTFRLTHKAEPVTEHKPKFHPYNDDHAVASAMAIYAETGNIIYKAK